MSDPRNAAHDKKVAQEKKHHHTSGSEPGSDAIPAGKDGKKPKQRPSADEEAATAAASGTPDPASGQEELPKAAHTPPPELEESLVVLAKLKDIAFHSNAHLAKLAELTLVVEDKLKQKDFVTPLGDVYAAEADFQGKLQELVTTYSAECDRLQTGA